MTPTNMSQQTNSPHVSGHHLKCGIKTIANQIGLDSSLKLYSMTVIMGYAQVIIVSIVYCKLFNFYGNLISMIFQRLVKS